MPLRDVVTRPAVEAAPLLLGALLTAGDVTVRLTEIEAYAGPDDPGSHAFRRTPRSAILYGPPGVLYVYFTYGMHHCVNVVCAPEHQAGAVLLRAGEVVSGVPVARARRVGVADRMLARGPACLARALALDLRANGSQVGTGPARLEVGPPGGWADRERPPGRSAPCGRPPLALLAARRAHRLGVPTGGATLALTPGLDPTQEPANVLLVAPVTASH